MKSFVRAFRRSAKQLLLFPISPRPFLMLVAALRAIGFFRKPIHDNTDRIEKILISHPYSMVGDMVLLLPLIERVRAEWPRATIDIATGGIACELLAGVTGLQRVFVCSPNRSRNRILGEYQRFFRNLEFYRTQIMPYDYDLVIAPRWGSLMTWEAIYIAYLTGTKLRVGYSSAVDGGKPVMDKLLTRTASGGQNEHETTRNLKLLDRVGLSQSEVSVESAVNRPIQSVLNLVHGNEDRQPLPSQINGAISRIEKYAVIAPGATKAYNIWPTEQLAITMQALHDQFSLYLYLIGSTADAPVCEELVRRMPEYATSMGGKTNLQEVARLISRAEIFVGMDSGMAHVAGALGKPTVVLFPFPSSCKEEHSNSAVRFRPAGPHVRVLQPEHPLPPCNPTCIFPGSHCITQIDPEQVITAARELLDEVSAGNEPPIKRSKWEKTTL